MPTKSDAIPAGITVRTEPVQQRSSERITALLDAAAELIDRNGIDGLTTSDVAARSGSSVGVVYRYFPNIQNLLRALAARNMEKFTDAIYQLMTDEPAKWMDALDATIDIYAELSRSEPGFRALRFGDVIDERFLHPDHSNNSVLADTFKELLVKRYGLEPTEELTFDIEVVVEMADAILHRAFLYEPSGDDRFLSKLREMVRNYMSKYESLSPSFK
jgi:AcrR family transcriptional regulator